MDEGQTTDLDEYLAKYDAQPDVHTTRVDTPMFKVEVTCWFHTKTAEQAEYIRQFFDDAQSLMQCESSGFSATEVRAVPSEKPWPPTGPGQPKTKGELHQALADLPRRFVEARKRRGASIRDVARATGLSLAGIHKIEHGGDPRLSTVIVLLRWLDEESADD